MSTAADWLRTAIDEWEQAWTAIAPSQIREVLAQNERLISELAKSNRLLAELYDIFIEGGYAEAGDEVLLDNIDAIVGPPSGRQS